jgi:hypothetical protein
MFKWEHHGNNQFIDHTKASFNGIKGDFIFKTISPWRIITPPGWSVLQLPLFYHFNKEWSVLPGIIDTDIFPEVNQQILYHNNGKEIFIKRGEPFVLYIPFKRDSRLNLKIRYKTKKDINYFIKSSLNISTKFIPNGSYRELQRKRDGKIEN